MNLELRNSAPNAAETELMVAFAADQNTSKARDAKPEVTLLTSDSSVRQAAGGVLGGEEFRAKPNETLLLHHPQGLKAARLLLVGVGKSAKASPHELRRAAGTAARCAKSRGIRSLSVLPPEGFSPIDSVRAIAEGAIVGDFDSDTYRTDRRDTSLASLSILTSQPADAAAETALREATIVAESQNFARSLINEPSNRMTPTILGRRAAEVAAEFGLKCEVHGVEKLRELKMGAFLGVAQGSDEPPALIVMTYEPEGGPPSRSSAWSERELPSIPEVFPSNPPTAWKR